MGTRLLLRGQCAVDSFHFNSITFFDPVHQVIGFRKKELGIQREHSKIWAHSRSEIEQDHSFHAEPGCYRNVFFEVVEGPAQYFFWTPIFSLTLYRLQMHAHSARS